MADAKEIIEKLRETEEWISGECDWRSYVVADAIDLIERLTKPIDLNSEEAFVVRALRTAAERTDAVLITANDGERLGLSECGSYAAKPSSKAVLALLDRLEKGAANG